MVDKKVLGQVPLKEFNILMPVTFFQYSMLSFSRTDTIIAFEAETLLL
jgi:hypothetical protein